MSVDAEVFVIGAGPAGLTAAYCLTKEARSVIIIERDPIYVGGISRTVAYKDFLFDIGGHRFFSKSKERCGRKSCPTISSPGRGCRASITTASSSPTR
jgi:thioredoxin reductase